MDKMYRVLAILCCAVLIAASGTRPGNAQQQPPTWADRKNATPGVQFSLQEVNREPYNGVTLVIYRLALTGAPEDKTYQVFNVGGVCTVCQMGWRADLGPAGMLLAEGVGNLPALPAAEINGKTFGINGYLKGEAVRLIVTSVDQTTKAFAEVFPFPLEARDGPCHLWAELIPNTQGRAFAFYGDGFSPGAKVLTSSHSGHEILNRTITVPDNGSLPPHIIQPAVVGQTSGEASFTAIGPACAPAVTYQWGPPALAPQ